MSIRAKITLKVKDDTLQMSDYDFSQVLFDRLFIYGNCCNYCSYYKTRCEYPYKVLPTNMCYDGVRKWAERGNQNRSVGELSAQIEKKKKYKIKYTELKAQHKCVRCRTVDERTEAGRVLCKECAEKQKEYYKQWKTTIN